MSIDPRVIQTPLPASETDGRGRACARCGYDLRGLTPGRVCPECGTPPAESTQSADAISAMPIRVVRFFRSACWLASLSSLGIIGLTVLQSWLPLTPAAHAAAMLGVSIVWLTAAFMLTPALTFAPAVSRGFSRRSRLRLLARWLQTGWVMMTVVHFIELTMRGAPPAATSNMFDMLRIVGMVIGLTGVFVLGLMLERLAEWARDNVAERALNFAIFGIPFSIIAIVVFSAISFAPLVVISFVLWIVSIAAFPWGLFSLTRSMTWAVHHAREHQAYLERRHHRDHEFESQRVERHEAADRARERRAIT